MTRLSICQCPPAFTKGCLPLVFDLALENEDKVVELVRDMPEHWTLEDKVVAVLLPSLKRDVEAFYKEGGKGMVEMFESHVLERLDRDLTEILRKRLQKTDFI